MTRGSVRRQTSERGCVVAGNGPVAGTPDSGPSPRQPGAPVVASRRLPPAAFAVSTPTPDAQRPVPLWIPVLLALVVALVSGASGLLAARTTGNLDDYNGVLFFIASGVIGALIVARTPAPVRRVGWIMLIGALTFSLMSFSTWYALDAYPLPTSGFSLERLLAWPQVFTWVAGAGSMFLLLPLYYPTGELADRRWRWLPRGIIVLGVIWMLAMAVIPGTVFMQEQPADPAAPPLVNPFGIDALAGPVPDGLKPVLQTAFPLAHLLLLILCTCTLVQRFARARGVARQQLTWFTAVVVGMPVIVLAERLLPWFPTLIASLYLPLIPAAIGITLLRGDLLTIERGASRLLTWITLLTCLAVVYLTLAGALGELFGGDGTAHERGVLAAAGLTVILFHPLRRRIEEGVQRLMYGEHASRYVVLTRLGQQLEQAQPLAGDSVLQSMVDTLREALDLPWAALSLHLPAPEGSNPAMPPVLLESGVGAPQVLRHALAIIYQQEQVGTLHVATHQPRDLGATERQLLDDLARQFGIAIHNLRLLEQTAQLNADLQRSRERLVLAREEERRRMRRELHDGLAPTLAALNLKAGMIRSRISRDPAAAELLLDDWRNDLRATIADVRRLAYELRPPILDEIGLLAAISERAHQVMSANPLLRIRIDAPERLPGLPAAVEVAAYRLVQEALTNVERHARAQQAEVSLWLDSSDADEQVNGNGQGRTGGWLHVAIIDDGVGLPSVGQRRAGVGVLAMRERAEELGGQCSIADRAELVHDASQGHGHTQTPSTSLPPHGVQVRATFPLPAAAAAPTTAETTAAHNTALTKESS